MVLIPLTDSLICFFKMLTQQYVNGTIRLKLFKRPIQWLKEENPLNSLYELKT